MRLPRPRFRHLRTKLAVLYAALFAVALVLLAVVAQVMIRAYAGETVRAELATSGSVYDRLWTLRVRSLTASATVLASDFGFRGAVASGDVATIESALANIRERANVSAVYVVEQDGRVVGPPARSPSPSSGSRRRRSAMPWWSSQTRSIASSSRP